ncbi:MAG TPA: hypothetical protein VD968_06895 [Pyrinomonadaceae bacterium]|nr:hypothetical protein [Pyrinomonadaceae bacterium]
MTWEVIGLGVLLVVCGLLVARVLAQKPQEKPQEETAGAPPAVKARKTLPAFHLLTKDDLDLSAFKEQADRDAQAAKFEGRRLLAAAKTGEALTEAGTVSKAASKSLTDDSLTASVPATPATTLGGRLKVNDVVNLVSVGRDEGTAKAAGAAGAAATGGGVNRAEGLVVIGLPAPGSVADKAKGEAAAAPPGAVVLAFPADKLDAFVKTLAGDSLVLARPPAAGPDQ